MNDKDDWDTGSKIFKWAKSTKLFSLENGQLIMEGDVPEGVYDLQVDVTDESRGESARSYIRVEVHSVPEIAFQNHGAIRLLMDEDELTGPSKVIDSEGGVTSRLARFKDMLQHLLGDNSIVEVFSIKQDVAVLQVGESPVVDLRFTARTANTFHSPVLLNGLISQNQHDFESAMNATILSVGIDMCKLTRCDNGCQTVNRADYVGSICLSNKLGTTFMEWVSERSGRECELHRDCGSQCHGKGRVLMPRVRPALAL